MTLNTARPTGKTTLFCELIDELEATGAYFGILLDFEQLADFSGERFYERLSQMLNRWQPIEKPTAVVPHTMRDQGDFVDWLRATTLAVGRRVVLLIDEFDAIPMETVKALLSQFRAIESLSSAGEMDILAFYRNQRFIVETKVWYGQARFDQGKAQLVAYLPVICPKVGSSSLLKNWAKIHCSLPVQPFLKPLKQIKSCGCMWWGSPSRANDGPQPLPPPLFIISAFFGEGGFQIDL